MATLRKTISGVKFIYLNLLGMTGVLIINYIASTHTINGYTTAEVSSLFPNLFVPAGITFSIWGVIYVFLIGFTLYPFLSDKTHSTQHVGYLFFISCVLNIVWLVAWHFLLLFFSVGIMSALLATLVIIYIKAHDHRPESKKEKWLVQKPFSIYLAWISVATIANVTALFVHLGFSPNTPDYWAVCMILATQLLVWIVNIRYHDIAFSLVIIWALIGLLIQQYESPAISLPIIYTAIGGILFTTLNAFYYRYQKTIS